ncbi:hypothetical protein [Klebsiella pneumoniae]|uniref:hypothetical protein n=1 Tax=Klebsiella pneumoniae TaxID=573 RepID=UPI0021B070D7|nr:hypothetical protein [Klebsiella pneumoniae]
MDSVHHIWCPLSSQEYQDLPDGAETTLTIISAGITHLWPEIFRATRRELRRALANYHRIEASTTFQEGERMLAMLGMRCEGHLKKFNHRGEDSSLWAITR